jgi:hypothetical protein
MESAFTDVPLHKQGGGMINPVAEEAERAPQDGEFNLHGGKAYEHWRMTGETPDGLFEVPNPEPAGESGESNDPLEHLTAGERELWLKDGTLPEKPAKTKQEEVAKESKEARAGSADEKGDSQDHPDDTTVDSITEHVKKITPEQHNSAVRTARDNIAKEIEAMPDGAQILEAAKRAGGLPEKLKGVLTHALADLPSAKNAAGVLRILVTNDAQRKQLLNHSPDQVIGIIHKLSAKVASESECRRQVELARKRYPDFDAVALSDNFPMKENTAMWDFVVGSKRSADIAYALGKNPKEFARIDRLPAVAQIRELMKIEASVAGSAGNSNKTARRITQAAAPIRVLSGNGHQSGDEVDQAIKEDDQEAYSRAANARDIARRRRD